MPGSDGRLVPLFAAASFQSLWYWILHAVIWGLVCYRTLGVPFDMLHRARGDTVVAGRVDLLAQMTAERVGGVEQRFGVPMAAALGFALAVLFVFGFLVGREPAQAGFVLLLPLGIIGLSEGRLAAVVRRQGLAGPELVLALARRQAWHQVIAVAAVMGALGVAVVLHPWMVIR